MARTAIERASNQYSHRYEWYSPGKCHICQDCGTAEHRNGDYWLVGRFSKIEPPCENGTPEQRRAWENQATPDPEMNWEAL